MNFQFEAPEKQTLSQRITDQLTEMIVAYHLPPGTLLPSEKELAERFGVSRMVIRESVQVLAALGLLDVRHGVGSFVNASSAWRIEEPIALLLRAERQSLMHWLEIRMLLETNFAELAATRATPENLHAMLVSIEKMQAQCNEPECCLDTDIEFHQEIARATGNPLALTLMRPILRPILRDHFLAVTRGSSVVQWVIPEHQAIYTSIAAHSPQDAREAMRIHLQRVTQEIKSLH